jgi:HK97 family phage portal protein
MKILGFPLPWSRKDAGVSINTLISRLEAIYESAAGIPVTPDAAMESPTVQALVQAIARRIATLPIRVVRKSMVDGKASKEELPDHPVALLMKRPAAWLTHTSYWLDATSWLVRYGNFYAFKARGNSGPIRRLVPLHPGCVTVKQDPNTLDVTYEVNQANGAPIVYRPEQIHHARGPARNGICGDSPVMDVRNAIALEIAAERFGGQFFGNGATPGLILKPVVGSKGFNSDEERGKFRQNLEEAYGKRGRHRVMVLPNGLEIAQQVPVEAEKAQFLQTRQYQRTVIAGAFGVPPHLVGDLSKGTFNNVEQQNLSFVVAVVLPYVRMFEDAMARDLLTDEERAQGLTIRFNLDAALRADFKTRQEGLNIMRQAGVISANEWREHENMNPISDEDGGDEYWRQGPSGQSATAQPGQEPEEPGAEEDTEGNDNED